MLYLEVLQLTNMVPWCTHHEDLWYIGALHVFVIAVGRCETSSLSHQISGFPPCSDGLLIPHADDGVVPGSTLAAHFPPGGFWWRMSHSRWSQLRLPGA
jgi:hypothetical protein